jgi:hypothetical protein
MPCCKTMGGGPGRGTFCSAPGTTCAPPAMGGEDRCQTCGAVGQPCCDGSLCRTGTCRREDAGRVMCR